MQHYVENIYNLFLKVIFFSLLEYNMSELVWCILHIVYCLLQFT